MSKKLFVLSVISIIYGALIALGGAVMLGYTVFTGEEITENMDEVGGGFFLLFGGFVWLAFVFLTIFAFILAVPSIVSGVLGIAASKKKSKGTAVVIIIINIIMLLGIIPMAGAVSVFSLILMVIPLLFVIFSSMYIKEINDSSVTDYNYDDCGSSDNY